jgi:peptidoglycan/xylan/chitin deacetylase (PgdA/CDA1 family)
MAKVDKRIIRAGLETLHFTGAARAMTPLFAGVGAILSLHRVRPPVADAFQPNRLLEVTPVFLDETILRLKARGVDLVSMDEAVRRLRDGDFTRRFVALTFDDGYRDNLEFAWPILQRHQAPATVFIATAFAEGTGELWWVALERAIAASDRVAFLLDGVERSFPATTLAEKNETFAAVYWLLRGRETEDDLRRVVRELAADADIDMAALCRELCMGWAEIAALARDPLITIGAHTVSHPMLRKLDADAARADMAIGADRTEVLLGRRPAWFAFPVGDASAAGPREFALAAELGFKAAVTTRPGMLYPEHAGHLTALPRIPLNGEFQRLRYLDVLLSGVPSVLLNGFRRVDAA